MALPGQPGGGDAAGQRVGGVTERQEVLEAAPALERASIAFFWGSACCALGGGCRDCAAQLS